MKKSTFFMLLMCLLMIGSRADAQVAYGWNRNDSQTPENIGPCKFDVGNPSGFQLLRTHDYGIRAGAFAGKKYYVQTCDKSGNDPSPVAFGTYDFDTGTFTKIATCNSDDKFYDMAYDYKNGIMYALGNAGRVSRLLKIDLGSGEVTEVAELYQEFVAIAIDLQGQIYAENPYSELVKLELDGNEETLNSCDYSAKSELQSMGIDHKTGRLWWAIPTSREGTQLLNIDLKSGYYDTNVELTGEKQIVGLDFPYSNVKEGAPGKVEKLEITPVNDGAKEVNITVKAPQNTVGGGTLGTFKIHLLRGNKEIFSKDNATAGELITTNETLTDNDLYTYKAYASNSEGNGEETVKQVYIGEDIPDAVTNIQLEKQTDGRSCKISWTSPAKGINGGYIPAGIKYDITRLPDNATIAEGIQETTFTDNTVTLLANYRYRITPVGREKGKAAMSEFIILGTSHLTPYQCNFTNDDMPLWTIIDRNHDGTTWKRRMASEGIYCSYNEKMAGDDWIISRPIALKGNTKYKIMVTASAANLELIEKMSLYFGKGDKEEDLTGFKEIGKFEVANEEGQRANYVGYYTPTADDNENFAIRMNSDPNKFQLEVFGIVIKEASEGSLHGTVKHDGAALQNVEISLKDTNFSTKTNAQGQWTMTNIPEADYTLEARKEGYALHTQPVQVSSEEDIDINITLNKIEKLTATGKVTFSDGAALKEAKVVMTAINGTAETTEYVAYTDNEGKYTVANIYEGTYQLATQHPGLISEQEQVAITKDATTLPVIELKDKAVAPRLVTVTAQDNAGNVKWEAPIDVDSISYHKGPGVAHIGVFSYTERSIVGTVFRKDMAITAVKWQTDEFRGPHKNVDLVIFALNSEGNPTNTILYEQKGIANTDNTWCRYELPQPLVVKGGALVAFRYNGFLSMLADAGVNDGLEFEPNVHVMNTDYANAAFEYLDQHDMKKNLLIGIDYAMLNADGTAIASTLQRQKQYKVYRKLEKEGENWQYLASTDVAVREYNDAQFGTLPMGYYRYAVTSVLASEKESGMATSGRIGRNLLADVNFKVKTNAKPRNSSPLITIKAADDNNATFTATKKDGETWTIGGVAKKKYLLHAELDGFDDIDETLTIEGEETEFDHELNFIERLLPAYNLKAEKQDEADKCLLSWNTDNFIFDGFESYEPFTVEPATKEMNWIYWDMDKAQTVEFDNLTFKHMGIPMSYMAFNPYQTTPSLALFDAGSLPYSGRQYLVSFGNRGQANNDFIFSPILNFTGKASFKFVIKNFTNALGAATIKVGYTEQEYPKTLNDIVWISQSINVSDKNWQEMTFDVPENAKRMVLLNETQKGYFLMIDNLFVGEETPYADGTVKKPIEDRATYEVKLDGNIVNGVNQSNKNVMLTALPKGKHTAEVTAVYESGRSQTKSITFETEGVSGIDEIGNDKHPEAYISNNGNHVHTGDAVTSWAIYDFKGSLIKKGNEHDIDLSTLPAGIYIMQLNGKTVSESIKIVRK